MALQGVYRRWLLAGPALVVAGVLAPAALGLFFEPRRTALPAVFLFGAGLFVSVMALAVTTAENWPPFKNCSRWDVACFVVAGLPLALVAVVGLIIAAEIGG